MLEKKTETVSKRQDFAIADTTNNGPKILGIPDRRYYEIRTEDIANTGRKILRMPG